MAGISEIKHNIVIPQNKDFSAFSKNTRNNILKNLRSVTSRDIGIIGDEMSKEENLIKSKEYISRTKINLVYDDPIGFVKGNPVFLCRDNKGLYVIWGVNTIGKGFDEIYFDNLCCFTNTKKNTSVLVYDFEGIPVLIGVMGDEYFIIYGNETIKLTDNDKLDTDSIESIIKNSLKLKF